MASFIAQRGVWAPILMVVSAWGAGAYFVTRPAPTPPPVELVGALRGGPQATLVLAEHTGAEDADRALRDYAVARSLAGQVPPRDDDSPPPTTQPIDLSAAATRPTTQPTSRPKIDREEAKRRAAEIRRRAEERKARAAASAPATAPTGALADQPPVQGEPPVNPEHVQPTQDDMAAMEEQQRSAPPRTRRRNVPAVTDQAARAASQPGEAPVMEPATQPDAAPAVPAAVPPSEDGRTEWFAFNATPWEDVIKVFAKRIGKPLIGSDDVALAIPGDLTYEPQRKFTKDEALDELNLLMHLQGYRFVELEDHCLVVPLSEMPQHIQPERVFASVDLFDVADLRSMDYVTVYIAILDRPATDVVDQFTDSVPEYARFAALEATNEIRFTGLVKDIRDFLELYRKVDRIPYDPREMKPFKIKTNASLMEQMIRALLDVEQPVRRFNPQTRQFEVSQNTAIKIMVDERTNTLFVKGTPDEHARVQAFLEQLDKLPDIGEFKTHVLEVKHGSAREIAELLNTIFQQEQGQQSVQQRFRQPNVPQPPRNRRAQPNQPNQPVVIQQGQTSPEDIFVEDIAERARKTVRLVADERTNTLIVYANEEGLKRVQEMLETIDKPVPSNFRTFEIANADAAAIQPTVQQIAQGMTTAGGRQGRNATVILDTTANALHVIADREAMAEIERIISQLDVEGASQERHVIELVNVRPSEMVSVVEQLLKSGAGATGGPARPATPPGRRGRIAPAAGAPAAGAVATSQVIALDAARLLIVLCTQEEWKKVEETIRIWDSQALSSTEERREFKVQRGDAAAIAATLTQLYRQYNHPTLGRSVPAIAAEGDTIYAYAVKPALEEIASLVESLDIEPSIDPLVILPLQAADATSVAQQVQPLLASAGGGGAGRRGSGGPGPSVAADAATNSLVIRADEALLEQITLFARDMDARVAGQTRERRFYTLKYADARDVVSSLNTLMASPGRGGGARGGGGSSPTKILQSGPQVVVEAPADQFPEIENLIRQMDDPTGRETVTKIVQLPGVDVAQLAQRLTNAFRDRSGNSGPAARFDADPTTESITLTCSTEVLPEAERLMAEFREMASGLVDETQFYQLKHATAEQTATLLQQQLTALFQQQSRNIASRIRVSPDTRTNRVIIVGPSIAVKQGAQLLAQLDVPEQELAPVTNLATETRKLPGQNVQTLAQILTQTFGNRQRPDKLQYKFSGDPLSEILVMSVPRDSVKEIDDIISQFTADAATYEMTERFYTIKHAKSDYVSEKLREMLTRRIENTRGKDMAGRVNVSADPRTNRIVLYAPKFAADMADTLLTELDQAGQDITPTTIGLTYADPAQVRDLINSMYGSGRTRRQGSDEKDIQATVTNNTLVVRAPGPVLNEIQTLVKQIDVADSSGIQVRTYELKVLRAPELAQQINFFLATLGYQSKPGQLRPGAFGEPTTNTLVVLVPDEHAPFIDGLVAKMDSSTPPRGEAQSYSLKVARASQVAPNLDQMLKAKVTELEGSSKQAMITTSVFSDDATNRLFVYAPQEYQDLAAEMVKMVDREVETGEILQIVPLNQADATKVAASINQSLQGPGGRGGGRQVRVVPEAGSNSLLLTGLPRDVEWARKLVNDIESSAGTTVPQMQTFNLKYSNSTDILDVIKGMFPASQSPLDTVAVTEDSYNNRLIVTAGQRRMRQISDMIAILDAKPEVGEGGLALKGGRQLYFVDIYRGDAWDITFDVEDLLPKPERGGPELSPDWDGKYIKVLCRPDEIDNVTRLIRQFDDRAKVERKVAVFKPRDFRRLQGYLIERMPGLEIQEVTEAEPDRSIIEELPPPTRKPTPRAGARGRNGEQAPPANQPAEPNSPPGRDAAAPRSDGLNVRLASFQPVDPDVNQYAPILAQAGERDTPARGAGPRRPVPTIQVMPDGKVIVSGPKDDVDDIEETIELLEEDLELGEVIRIFEFKYGDVTSAAQILERMFNEPQAAQIARQQAQVQQQMMQQQQQQQRQQRGGGDDDEGGEGGRGGAGGGAGGIFDTIRGMAGGGRGAGGRGAAGAVAGGAGGGGSQLRIATDVGHNRLIIKCEETLLPEIVQLLRELDIPPNDVDVRVFQLRSLDAEETANNIKEVLGISRARQGRATAPNMGGGGRNPQQQQLLQILEQQMAVAMPGGEGGGTKIESVEIVPNRVTNSLMVSAPQEVMEIVSKVISDLEGLEGRDLLVIRHYELENAKVGDVLPLMQEVFAGTKEGGAGAARSPAALGPVTISGDPRSNTLIVSAEAKDLPVVENQIKLLDVVGAVSEAETYVVRAGDAESIAQVLRETYVGGGAGGGGPGGRGPAGAAASDVRITAEPATNTIVVFGSAEKRQTILEKARELDKLSPGEIREIKVALANPEKLAAKLMQVFGGRAVIADAAAGGPGGRSGRGGPQIGQGERIVVIGDKNANKLLVRAPDDIFEQMRTLVETLDVASESLQLQHFPLRYADATETVESVKRAVTEFMAVQRQMGAESEFDAFTAMPDPRTNSVVVVGSPETFLFVDRIIRAVDVATPEDQRRTFRAFVVQEGDVEVLAQMINSISSQGGSGGGPRGGPGGRGGPGSARGGSLDVVAEADPQAGMLLVWGKPEDVKQVEQDIIVPRERQSTRQIARIPVVNAPATQVAAQILQYWGGENSRPAPQVSGNDAGKTVVVWGTEAEIRKVRALAENFDSTDAGPEPIRVIALPLAMDAMSVARELQNVIQQREQAMAQAANRQPRAFAITAEPSANALIVNADSTVVAMVEGIVNQLQDVRGNSRMVTRVIRLDKLSSEDAQNMINDLQGNRSRGGSSGAVRPAGGGGIRGGGGNFNPGGGFPGGGAFTPRGGGMNPGGGSFTPPSGDTPSQPPRENRRNREGRGGGGGDNSSPNRGRRSDAGSTRPQPALAHAGWSSLVLFFQNAAQDNGAQPAGSPPATQPADVIDGLSGELRGPVFANPLDSRQIVVTGDERDIEFIEQMLRLMEQTTPAARIEVVTLKNTKAAALQAPVTQTVQQFLASSGAAGRADAFSIIAETRSNSLIVSASDANMEMILDIIEKLDLGIPAADFRRVALNNIQAAEAAGLLRPIIERLNAVRGNPPEQQVSVEALDRANSLLIIGTPTDIAEIEKLVESIDVELGPEQGSSAFSVADVMIVNLENANAEELAEVLTELIEAPTTSGGGAGGAAGGAAGGGRRSGSALLRRLVLKSPDGRELPPLDLDRPIVIKAEPGTNSLIIFSNPKNNQALREIVSIFDALPRGVDIDVKAIVLEHAPSEQVAQLLEDMFEASKAALKRPTELDESGPIAGEMPPLPTNPAGRGLPYNVTVTHDPRSNTVIVIGRKDAVLLAASMIAQLDKPSTQLSFRPYVIQLKNMQATTMQEKLSEILEQRLSALGIDQANAARDSAVVVAEDRSNSLMMFASPDIYAMISNIVAEVDAASSYRIVETRFRQLQYADAAKLAGLLQDLFEKKNETESELSNTKDRADVVADTRSNALVMVGTRDYLDEAEQMITRLDQRFEPTIEFRVRPVILGSASNIAAKLTDMIENTRDQQPEEMRGSPVYVAADAYSNNLLIAAAREDMVNLERWIELLDRPAEPGRTFTVIPVRNRRAVDLATNIDELFTAAGGEEEADVVVSFDASTNSLIVVGPPTKIRDIERMVRDLDRVQDTAAAIVRHFKLEQAAARDTGELLRAIVHGRGASVGGTGGGGGGGGADSGLDENVSEVMLIFQKLRPDASLETLRAMRTSIRIIDDSRTNSLYVTAPVESMPLIESLVAAIDIPPDAARVRVFTLRNSTAEEMVTMLEELFEAPQGGGTGGGTGADQELVLAAGEGGVSGREQLSFTQDVRTNSVVAAGTKGYLDLVEQLIFDLDSKPIDEIRTIVYEPRNTTAEALRTLIEDYNDKEKAALDDVQEDISASLRLERDIRATSTEDLNRLILSYSPRRESEVLQLVRDLDQPPPQVMIQVLIIEVSLDNSLELGVEFAFQDLQWTKAGPQDTTTFDFVGGTDLGAAGSGLGGFSFTITGADFNFLVRTLQSEGKLNVLSRPQIVAMDNRPALIDVANDVPYVTSTSTSDAGQITTQVARENIGIRVEVTPQINPDGFVRMEIVTEVSDLTDSTVAVAPGVTAPIFFRRQAETFVTVRDNETVVLGGLITSREAVSEQKVPIAGDIPIVGTLFRTDNREETRRELLLVLTPRVVRTVEDFRSLSRDERDRTGLIPPEVLTSPLMQNLRVIPKEELEPEAADIEPIEPMTPRPPVYGPTPAPRTGPDPASYDIPLTRPR